MKNESTESNKKANSDDEKLSMPYYEINKWFDHFSLDVCILLRLNKIIKECLFC